MKIYMVLSFLFLTNIEGLVQLIIQCSPTQPSHVLNPKQFEFLHHLIYVSVRRWPIRRTRLSRVTVEKPPSLAARRVDLRHPTPVK